MNKIFLFALVLLLAACGAPDKEEVTIYTHRHYDVDQQIFEDFEEETGIHVNVVKASADELIERLQSEGDQSPADLLMTVDAGRLVRAADAGLLQPITSETVTSTIPEKLRANDNSWVGLTKRARIIVYSPERVNPENLSTYEGLMDSTWNDRLLIRSSGNIYNQSLMASVIANLGEETARAWASGVVENFARTPSGNDRDQVKAILAGEGDLAVINTYYLGLLLNSSDQQEAQAGEAVKIFWPNQNDRGAHINVSGVGLTANAPNAENAVRLIEFLISKEVQELYASANFEYPANPNAAVSDQLKSWGEFKEDDLALNRLGELNDEAVTIFDEVGWP
ncbi:MAG: Fe(3+) ABC transporter substrate-binding protein [Bacteroidota bacterium]